MTSFCVQHGIVAEFIVGWVHGTCSCKQWTFESLEIESSRDNRFHIAMETLSKQINCETKMLSIIQTALEDDFLIPRVLKDSLTFPCCPRFPITWLSAPTYWATIFAWIYRTRFSAKPSRAVSERRRNAAHMHHTCHNTRMTVNCIMKSLSDRSGVSFHLRAFPSSPGTRYCWLDSPETNETVGRIRFQLACRNKKSQLWGKRKRIKVHVMMGKVNGCEKVYFRRNFTQEKW